MSQNIMNIVLKNFWNMRGLTVFGTLGTVENTHFWWKLAPCSNRKRRIRIWNVLYRFFAINLLSCPLKCLSYSICKLSAVFDIPSMPCNTHLGRFAASWIATSSFCLSWFSLFISNCYVGHLESWFVFSPFGLVCSLGSDVLGWSFLFLIILLCFDSLLWTVLWALVSLIISMKRLTSIWKKKSKNTFLPCLDSLFILALLMNIHVTFR